MILANGLYGNPGGRSPQSDRPTLPTAIQRRAVKAWATRPLADYTRRELETALRTVTGHPDAFSPGYSQAKATRERLEAALATFPAA